MNTNKILLGGILGGITFFILGWLIYGIALADYMAAHSNTSVNRPMEEMIWWAMILSNLISGFLMAFILSWSGTSNFVGGLKIGAIVGLLFGLSIDLSFYAMTTMFSDMNSLFIDIVVYSVMTALASGVIAWAMNMGKKQ